jgi:hypothetical protein
MFDIDLTATFVCAFLLTRDTAKSLETNTLSNQFLNGKRCIASMMQLKNKASTLSVGDDALRLRYCGMDAIGQWI